MTRTSIALVAGILCQSAFVLAVIAMMIGLHGEMRGYGISFGGWEGMLWNCILLLLFPLVHSVLLGSRGRRFLSRLAPGEFGRHLITTSFVTISSLQLIALFVLWSPIGGVSWQPEGWLRVGWEMLYVASWLLLGVAMVHAGLGIQMGFLGWTSVLKGVEPVYPSFPQGGLYTLCRHPVYFAMALVSSTGPVWTIDHGLICAIFLLYCIVGPAIKDRRFQRMFGEKFSLYRERMPFFPTPKSVVRAVRHMRV